MLGVAWIPFCNVPYSNEETSGIWTRLFTELDREMGAVKGGTKPTSHELLIDVRFETGADLTLEEVLGMQNTFDSVWRFDGLDNVEMIDDHSRSSFIKKKHILIHIKIRQNFRLIGNKHIFGFRLIETTKKY